MLLITFENMGSPLYTARVQADYGLYDVFEGLGNDINYREAKYTEFAQFLSDKPAIARL